MVNSASPCRFYLIDINMQRVQSSIVLLRGVDQKISQCFHSECCCLQAGAKGDYLNLTSSRDLDESQGLRRLRVGASANNS